MTRLTRRMSRLNQEIFPVWTACVNPYVFHYICHAVHGLLHSICNFQGIQIKSIPDDPFDNVVILCTGEYCVLEQPMPH